MFRLGAAALSLALLGAVPLPTVYVAPAGSRPAGAPNPLRPFDAVLPDGRISAPVGRSVAVGPGAKSVVLSSDGRFAIVSGGDSISVVRTATMAAENAYAPAGADFSAGLGAARDPVNPGETLLIASLRSASAVQFLRLDGRGSLSADGAPLSVSGGAGSVTVAGDRTAYVANDRADTVTSIDLASRHVTGSAAVGFLPDASVVVGDRLYVTDPGLMRYAPLPAPARVPPFANVAFSPGSSSSLTSVALNADGSVSASGTVSATMDQAPDGATIVGGAKPTAIVVSKDGRYAYVCMENVDRVAVVDLFGEPRVASGLQLRLFDKAPYGTQPDAIAWSPDRKRLYVALAGMDAIAVLDARNPVKLHRLGLIPTGWYPVAIAVSANGRFLYVVNAKGFGARSTLQRIDLHRLPLGKTTLSALRYARIAVRPAADPIVPPLRSAMRSSAIAHVVFIRAGGAADAASMPNLHALADQFAQASNFYAEALPASDDPEAYPRDGYVFNAAARLGEPYRDYGGLLCLTGYDRGVYTLDTPALAALAGHVDLQYPFAGAGISDELRAKEFVRDYGQFERQSAAPSFAGVWLPNDGGPDGVADADRALGTVVEFLTHQASWNSTAIFIAADEAPALGNGLDADRSYAIVVSPYAKRHYSSSLHLSTSSLEKTQEEILGMQPLTLRDLLAADLASFFTATPDPSPYSAVRAP